ncbi:biliverdin-producing heme oxygenase [Nocardioides sp. MAH-18]|uniref:heme oxygenase (biliverdin-producing) n=1 Tax=Nocardioides agri TaxID=2682843 RepID=A0A6L6XNJ1_9ACTN|nr:MULTISPECIES: biliverdin-producing heme oxygenase [unclassified Nocardioides]MBA2953952.1 biliverdin-producing heme oxygenase [Nocardioides sp. CGMCC 1.13656]MVQ48814.1 biliverdin-producing heme oxygenase [Nocardioides sp. MAH-18]
MRAVRVVRHGEPTTEPTLSVAMREGSQAEHRAAEDSAFMSELLGGRVDERGYADYLLRLRRVYAVMEAVVRAHHHEPAVAAVHDAALERLAAIDADLDHWSPGVDRTVASPATDAYCARLCTAADEWPTLLVAHHYTRYLGDLSGGQAIGRILDRTFDLDGAGIAFYDFPEVGKPKVYKDGYRARLDALDLTADETARVVEEVRGAFRLNRALFAELGENLAAYAR